MCEDIKGFHAKIKLTIIVYLERKTVVTRSIMKAVMTVLLIYYVLYTILYNQHVQTVNTCTFTLSNQQWNNSIKKIDLYSSSTKCLNTIES